MNEKGRRRRKCTRVVEGHRKRMAVCNIVNILTTNFDRDDTRVETGLAYDKYEFIISRERMGGV